MKLLLWLLSASTLTDAFEFQLPFNVPFFKAKVPSRLAAEPDDLVPRVAIIGAGAGGSSAAFWLQKAKERFNNLKSLEVDVYETESYVGGRSTVVYPHDDLSLAPIELGASIFVKTNKNLWRAADEFNLTRRQLKGEDSDMGIWDGENIIFSVGNSWWDSFKVIWRYGIMAPRRTQNIVDEMVRVYLRLYSPNPPRWETINDLSTAFGWSELVSRHTAEYFGSKGVSEKYIYELLEAATRVNYGQNADKIHALEGAASLAATGATAIKGGNFQVFERFLENATLYINTTVHSIAPRSQSSHHWSITTDNGTKNYKAVIIAFPLPGSRINLPAPIASQIPKQPYVHLHVTLLTTTSPTINPAFLNLPLSSKVPPTLLTTYHGVRNGGKEPEFNSLSYHGQVREGEWSVKIFSQQTISDEWLDRAFGKGNVTWVHRKQWDAYPYLPPNATFAPTRLDKGLFYVNAFEPFISTMETETVASRNVVDFLLNEEFESSICGSRISSNKGDTHLESREKDFVYGWDC